MPLITRGLWKMRLLLCLILLLVILKASYPQDNDEMIPSGDENNPNDGQDQVRIESADEESTEAFSMEDDAVNQAGNNEAEQPEDFIRQFFIVFGDVPDELLPSETLLNRLLDSSCEIRKLLKVLVIALARNDFGMFKTACVSCMNQYNPEIAPIMTILDFTIFQDEPEYFAALLDGQCKGAIAGKILSQLPTLPRNFIIPAIEKCARHIPRHAIEAWRSEQSSKLEMLEPSFKGVTVDLHAQINWNGYLEHLDTKRGPVLVGLDAKYNEDSSGTIEILGNNCRGKVISRQLSELTSQ